MFWVRPSGGLETHRVLYTSMKGEILDGFCVCQYSCMSASCSPLLLPHFFPLIFLDPPFSYTIFSPSHYFFFLSPIFFSFLVFFVSLFLSLFLLIFLIYSFSINIIIYLPIYLPTYLSINILILSIYLSICLSTV